MGAYIPSICGDCSSGTPCATVSDYYLRGMEGGFRFELTAGNYIFRGFDAAGDGWDGGTAAMADAAGSGVFSLTPACDGSGCPQGDAFGLGSPPPTGTHNLLHNFSISPTQTVTLTVGGGSFDEEISWDVSGA